MELIEQFMLYIEFGSLQINQIELVEMVDILECSAFLGGLLHNFTNKTLWFSISNDKFI